MPSKYKKLLQSVSDNLKSTTDTLKAKPSLPANSNKQEEAIAARRSRLSEQISLMLQRARAKKAKR